MVQSWLIAAAVIIPIVALLALLPPLDDQVPDDLHDVFDTEESERNESDH